MKKLLLFSSLLVSFVTNSQTNIETDALKACELISKYKSIGELYGYGPTGTDLITSNSPSITSFNKIDIDEKGNISEKITTTTINAIKNGDVIVDETYQEGKTKIHTQTRTVNGVTVIAQYKEYINDEGISVFELTDETSPLLKIYHNIEDELYNLLFKYGENKTFRLYMVSNCKFLANVIQDIYNELSF